MRKPTYATVLDLDRRCVWVWVVIGLAILFLMSGCSEPMTNEEIVESVEFCEEHNLVPQTYSVFASGLIIEIQCAPRKNHD